jgi:hypothetical protein
MSLAIPVQVAKDIALEIENHTFTLNPGVHRRYMQEKDLILKNNDDLRIDVQVGDCVTHIISRAETKYLCRTDIAVRKHFTQAEEVAATGEIDTDEIDRLILLVQQIHDFFSRNAEDGSGRRLATFNNAAFDSAEFRPLYVPAHLREHRQFTGIVAVEYGVIT